MIRNPGKVWGATPEEHAAAYPCDAFVTAPYERLTRAVDVAAARALVFRWLCQLKVAPYSYDWIDNRGRTSPRELLPGLDELAVGERFMRIFELAEFEPDSHLTLVPLPRAVRVFGRFAMTYRVTTGAAGTRLVGVIDCEAHDPWNRLRAEALAVGDWVMMRKQLMTFKELAERDAGQPASTSG